MYPPVLKLLSRSDRYHFHLDFIIFIIFTSTHIDHMFTPYLKRTRKSLPLTEGGTESVNSNTMFNKDWWSEKGTSNFK